MIVFGYAVRSMKGNRRPSRPAGATREPRRYYPDITQCYPASEAFTERSNGVNHVLEPEHAAAAPGTTRQTRRRNREMLPKVTRPSPMGSSMSATRTRSSASTCGAETRRRLFLCVLLLAGAIAAPAAQRADQITVPGGQLRYVNCPQAPFLDDTTATNVCNGI